MVNALNVWKGFTRLLVDSLNGMERDTLMLVVVYAWKWVMVACCCLCMEEGYGSLLLFTHGSGHQLWEATFINLPSKLYSGGSPLSTAPSSHIRTVRRYPHACV